MKPLARPSARLAHREALPLRGHPGDRIHCRYGSVWVTQDKDPRDHILDAGHSITLDRTGATIVYAFADSGITMLRSTSSGSNERQGAAHGLLELIRMRTRAAAARVWRLLIAIADARWQGSYHRHAVVQRLSEIDAHTLRAIGIDPGHDPPGAVAAVGRVEPTSIPETLPAHPIAAPFRPPNPDRRRP